MLTTERIAKMPTVTILTTNGTISTAKMSDISILPAFYRRNGMRRKDVSTYLKDNGATFALAIRKGFNAAMKNFV